MGLAGLTAVCADDYMRRTRGADQNGYSRVGEQEGQTRHIGNWSGHRAPHQKVVALPQECGLLRRLVAALSLRARPSGVE